LTVHQLRGQANPARGVDVALCRQFAQRLIDRAGIAAGYRTGLAALLLAWCASAPAFGQACSFNPAQPNVASFGTIDPTLSTTMTFSLTVNYKCTGSAVAAFTITGANDTGLGAFRLRNLVQTTQYMAYSVTTADAPGTKLTLTGQLFAVNYQNAYVGSYTDTLSVLVLP